MGWLIETALANAAVAALLAVLAWSVSRFTRRPALTHAMWVLVLVKLVTPPLFDVTIPVPVPAALAESPAESAVTPSPSPQRAAPPAVAEVAEPVAEPILVASGADRLPAADSASPAAAQSVATDPHGPAVRRAIAWREVASLLIAMWAAGSSVVAFVLLRRLVLFAMVLRPAAVAPRCVQRQADELAARLGRRRSPSVRMVGWNATPMLFGCGPWTWLLFPRDLWDDLDEPARHALLMHELAHFRRGDQWVRLLELTAAVLFWWHPAVWAARRAIAVSEEECCDALVVAHSPYVPRVYAGALLAALEFVSGPPSVPAPVTSGVGALPEFTQRLTQIMQRSVRPSLSGGLRWGIVGACALILPLAPSIAWRPAAQASAAPSARPEPAALPAPLTEAPREEPSVERRPEPAVATPAEPALPGWMEEPDPQWAVAGSPDRRFRLRVQTGRRVRLERTDGGEPVDLTEAALSAAAFTPDGSRFVTGSTDGRVRLWDAAVGKAVSTLGWHQAPVTTVAVAPSGEVAVTGAKDGTVMVWEIASGRPVGTYIDPERPIVCVRFAPDGTTVAVAAGHWQDMDEYRIALLDDVDWEPRRSWSCGSVAAVEFTADGTLVSADWAGNVRRWDPEWGQSWFVGSVPKSVVTAATFSADARLLGDARP